MGERFKRGGGRQLREVGRDKVGERVDKMRCVEAEVRVMMIAFIN